MTLRDKISVNITFPNSYFTGDKTYSSLFLVPAFNLNMDSDLYDYFVNTYLGDHEVPTATARPFFLLLETNEITSRYKRVHEELLNNKAFVYHYCAGTYNGKLLYMYVFECPDEFRTDYDRFLRGEYSKFSPIYKSRFARLVPNERSEFVESPLFGAIYKTRAFKKEVESRLFGPGESLDKEQEYFGKPDRKIEIFRYTDSKNKYDVIED